MGILRGLFSMSILVSMLSLWGCHGLSYMFLWDLVVSYMGPFMGHIWIVNESLCWLLSDCLCCLYANPIGSVWSFDRASTWSFIDLSLISMDVIWYICGTYRIRFAFNGISWWFLIWVVGGFVLTCVCVWGLDATSMGFIHHVSGPSMARACFGFGWVVIHCVI